ncbi:hypothetical protein B0J14DRAFT_664886 [Halenospora varia]|nr:hypothetical protein B0J14DRAFT_664886 [Halenospora varia]
MDRENEGIFRQDYPQFQSTYGQQNDNDGLENPQTENKKKPKAEKRREREERERATLQQQHNDHVSVISQPTKTKKKSKAERRRCREEKEYTAMELRRTIEKESEEMLLEDYPEQESKREPSDHFDPAADFIPLPTEPLPKNNRAEQLKHLSGRSNAGRLKEARQQAARERVERLERESEEMMLENYPDQRVPDHRDEKGGYPKNVRVALRRRRRSHAKRSIPIVEASLVEHPGLWPFGPAGSAPS